MQQSRVQARLRTSDSPYSSRIADETNVECERPKLLVVGRYIDRSEPFKLRRRFACIGLNIVRAAIAITYKRSN